eukprot:TRINITY_DN67289_c5_g2_i1.p1 TRINITY_DN67289_c5_g2~~TRINITY_DN67289_c5_g2_i1.p1  ORF type:complete len:118 (+),score=17.61 TRINITY_DN67289_c5_g2_i1:277-630(+)
MGQWRQVKRPIVLEGARKQMMHFRVSAALPDNHAVIPYECKLSDFVVKEDDGQIEMWEKLSGRQLELMQRYCKVSQSPPRRYWPPVNWRSTTLFITFLTEPATPNSGQEEQETRREQ